MVTRRPSGRSRLALSRGALLAVLLVGWAVAAGTVLGAPAVARDGSPGATGPETTVSLTNASLAPDETATADVVLAGAGGSVTGFELTVALGDGDVGRFANASYPAAFEVSSDPIERRDGRALRLKAADLDGDLDTEGPIRLATVRVAGQAAGRTEATVEDLQVDDGSGSALTPAREAGVLSVGDAGGAAAAGDGGEATAAQEPPGESGAVGPLLASLAAGGVLAVGALALRRRRA